MTDRISAFIPRIFDFPFIFLHILYGRRSAHSLSGRHAEGTDWSLCLGIEAAILPVCRACEKKEARPAFS